MLSRRDALQLFAAGGVSLSTGILPGHAAATPGPTALDTPQSLLTAFMRLSGSLDDRLIIKTPLSRSDSSLGEN